MAAAGALEAGVLVTLAKGTASGTEEEKWRLLLLSDGEAGLQRNKKELSTVRIAHHSSNVQLKHRQFCQGKQPKLNLRQICKPPDRIRLDCAALQNSYPSNIIIPRPCAHEAV